MIAAVALWLAAAAQPATLLRASVSDREYPKTSLAAREQGDVTVRFDVGDDGRVSNCQADKGSGFAALDAVSCAIVGRWRYKPARDNLGKPVASTQTQVFAWRIKAPCGSNGPTTNDPTTICITR